MKKLITKIALSGIAISFFAGCAVSNNMQEFNQSFNSGEYKKAQKIADEKAMLKDSFWILQRANMNYLTKDYDLAIKDYDAYENSIKSDDENKFLNTLGQSVVSTVGNDSWYGYEYQTYEGILVNTYKAISFMSLNDKTNARIELNRALERQRRAKDEYSKEIEKLQTAKEEEKQKEQKKLAEVKAKTQNAQVGLNPNKDKDIQNIIEQKYTNLFSFSAYPDFVNPYTSYLSALYFYLEKDYKKARDIFKETYGMTKSLVALEDFKLCENSIKNKSNEKYSWIIVEDGLSTIKKEWRLDLPLFMVTNKAYLVSVALPTLKDRDYAFRDYIATNSQNNTNKSYEIASMDNIIKSEFKKDFDAILFRAISSMTFKTLMKFQLSREYGQGGAFVGELYSVLTTKADERIVTTMPKSFRVIRVPAKGEITLKSKNGMELIKFDSKNENSITFVRIPTTNSKYIYNTIYFDDNNTNSLVKK